MTSNYEKGISIVLGAFNRKRFLKKTIESIRCEQELLDCPSEIIVVDGGSDDGSLNWLSKQKDIITIVQHNRGVWRNKKIPRRSWGYFMNLGFRSAQYRYVSMVSDDCLIHPKSLRNGIEQFERRLENNKKTGAIAFYWRDWPFYQEYYVGLTLSGNMFLNHGIYLKDALDDVDYIDHENYQFYYGDCDLCLKMWNKGWEVVDSDNSYVEHFSHANVAVRKVNHSTHDKDRTALLKKWDGIYSEDSGDSAVKKLYDGGYDHPFLWKSIARKIIVIKSLRKAAKTVLVKAGLKK